MKRMVLAAAMIAVSAAGAFAAESPRAAAIQALGRRLHDVMIQKRLGPCSPDVVRFESGALWCGTFGRWVVTEKDLGTAFKIEDVTPRVTNPYILAKCPPLPHYEFYSLNPGYSLGDDPWAVEAAGIYADGLVWKDIDSKNQSLLESFQAPHFH